MLPVLLTIHFCKELGWGEVMMCPESIAEMCQTFVANAISYFRNTSSLLV